MVSSSVLCLLFEAWQCSQNVQIFCLCVNKTFTSSFQCFKCFIWRTALEYKIVILQKDWILIWQLPSILAPSILNCLYTCLLELFKTQWLWFNKSFILALTSQVWLFLSQQLAVLPQMSAAKLASLAKHLKWPKIGTLTPTSS